MKWSLEITDVHSHVLPGLDDGPVAMDDSLRMCELYRAEGVRTVVATPHMGDPRYGVTAEAVRDAVRRLSDACRERGIDLAVLPGAEVRLRPELLDDLDAGRLLTVADAGTHLFLEMPHHHVPPVDDLVFRLAVRGITPVVTHPERNADLASQPARLAGLVEQGCLVQITAASLLGELGRPARKAAERFLKSGLVDIVASDAHSPTGARRPRFAPALKRLRRLVGEEKTFELLCGCPGRLVGVLSGGPLRQRRGAASR